MPIYKISLAEMIVGYKKKVKENAAILAAIKSGQGRCVSVAFAYRPTDQFLSAVGGPARSRPQEAAHSAGRSVPRSCGSW